MDGIRRGGTVQRCVEFEAAGQIDRLTFEFHFQCFNYSGEPFRDVSLIPSDCN